MAAGSLLVTEAGGLVGNYTGEANFLDQAECVAANPRIYAQLVSTLGKYSKFAGAGDKANVRQALQDDAATQAGSAQAADAPRLEKRRLSGKKLRAGAAGSPAVTPEGDTPL